MLTARGLLESLRQRDRTVLEVTEDFLTRIERNSFGTFQEITSELALRDAKQLDNARSKNAQLPELWGLPIAHKDNVDVAGVPTRHGSRSTPRTPCLADAPVAATLRQAGVVNLGKTQVPEFAISGYSENSIAPPVLNPHDETLTAGGSSGGAAAAVARGLVPVAPGNDGGGSIRIPAAACGVVGLQAGRDTLAVDRPDAHNSAGLRLSVSGVLARDAADAALLFDAMGGSNALSSVVRADSVTRFRVGISTASPFDYSLNIQLDDEVQQALRVATLKLTHHGHHLEDADIDYLPGYEQAFTDNWQGGFSDTEFTKEQISVFEPFTRYSYERGKSLSQSQRSTAVSRLREIAANAQRQWGRFDVVLTPTVAWLPPKLGYFSDAPVDMNFRLQCEWMPYTSITNVTGNPAISVPVHVTPSGFPVSVQLIGPAGSENRLLQLAAQIQLKK